MALDLLSISGGIYMKIIRVLISLGAILLISSSCMTSAAVKRAKGYTNESIQPMKGDVVILHDGLCYVVPQEHSENAEKMPPTIQTTNHPPYFAFKPSPGCYGLITVTVPLDVATSPFQLIGLGLEAWFLYELGRTP